MTLASVERAVLLGLVGTILHTGALAHDTYYRENFTSTEYRDDAHTTALWENGRLSVREISMHREWGEPLSDAPQCLTVSDDRAYVGTVSGVLVVDVSDSTHPDYGTYTLQTGIPSVRSTKAVAIHGGYTYIATGSGSLEIADLSGGGAGTFVGAFLDPSLAGVYDVALSGNYAYAVDLSAGLVIVDVSDPTTPVRVGSCTLAAARNVAIGGGFAYVSTSGGIAVVDVSDPTTPVRVATAIASSPAKIVLAGDFIYVIDNGRPVVIDVSDPYHPVRRGAYATNNATDIARGGDPGDVLFVADRNLGLLAVDVTDPDSPLLFDSALPAKPTTELALSGQHVYLCEVEDPTQWTRYSLGSLSRIYNLPTVVAQSLPINSSGRPAFEVKLSTSQQGEIHWELSADGGANWQPVEPGADWQDVEHVGTELIWRASLVDRPNVAAWCDWVEVDYVYGFRAFTIRPDGTGDEPTIQDGVYASLTGDTLLLADGTFTGEANWDVNVNRGLVIRSESGDPESCVIDAGAAHPGIKMRASVDRSVVVQGVTITNATYALTDDGTSGASPTFVGCRFVDSEVGAACGNMDSPLFIGCEFAGNTKGAVAARASEFVDCTFIDNQGVGLEAIQHTVVATGCTFSGNGGAGATITGAEGHFTDCDFDGNAGGGISSNSSALEVRDNRFVDNAPGGAIHYVGDFSSNLVVTGSLFAGNSAPLGGAAFVQRLGQWPRLVGSFSRCTFDGNAADEGSAIYLDGDQALDSLLVNRAIMTKNTGSPPIRCVAGAWAKVTCSDVYGNPAGDWVDCIAGREGVDGNISEDPLFCGADTLDFRLYSDSPCLAGSCGFIGAYGQGCVSGVVFDMVPGSCANPFDLGEAQSNPGDNLDDMFDVVVLGTNGLHVADLDPATIRLEGVAATWCGYGDVERPGSEAGGCPVTAKDGRDDMTLKFPPAEVAAAIGSASPGDVVALTLSGKLHDGTVYAVTDRVTIVDESAPSRGSRVILGPVIPNPFNPKARITYYLPRRMHVELTVYDVAGRVVARLLDATMPAGDHDFTWNTNGEASGVYFARLSTPEGEEAYKLVMMK